MTHPTGAITTLEEMQAMIGKQVYLNAAKSLELPLMTGNILRLTIKSAMKDHKDHDHKERAELQRFVIVVAEKVHAYAQNAIIARPDFTVYWRGHPRYFFTNYWFALAYALREPIKNT